MGRRRRKNKHLPPRVQYKNGAHYFTPYVNGKLNWIFLGRSPNPDSMSDDALSEWRRQTTDYAETYSNTMDYVFDKYIKKELIKLAEKTQTDYLYSIARLRAVFGHMKPKLITAQHLYKYQEIKGENSPVAANRDNSVMSAVFTAAIKWGDVTDNECWKVKRLPEKPRRRYADNQEFMAVYNEGCIIIKCAMSIIYHQTQRKGDILDINKNTDITDKGIYFDQNKRGKKLLVKWKERMREDVNRLLEFRKHLNSEYLFCNNQGERLTESGFDTLWQKARGKALEKGTLKKSFTFHDLKAKSVTDDKGKKAHIRAGHSDPKLTERIYNRLTYEEVDSIETDVDMFAEEEKELEAA